MGFPSRVLKEFLAFGNISTTTLDSHSLRTVDMDYIHLKDMRASGFEPTNVLSEYKYQDGAAYYESTPVRANNAGNFSNGITNIESMYAPEFSGHTKGIRVEIKE